jgi:hypothetical protein
MQQWKPQDTSVSLAHFAERAPRAHVALNVSYGAQPAIHVRTEVYEDRRRNPLTKQLPYFRGQLAHCVLKRK